MKRLSLVLLWGLLLPVFTYAEITNPYTIDEKSQVLFGDSTDVNGKNGLENYLHDYVNNYLHLTFTYTHSRFGLADYSPRLYITDVDPAATTTVSVRDQSMVYQLLPIPIPPGHETDWYLYDIQFDATGYSISVTQEGATSTASFHKDISGLTDTDYAALANLYPKGEPASSFAMAFAPLAIYEAPAPPIATTTPVIIVPGIMSTNLLENNNLIWPNTIEIVTSITDSFLDALKMDEAGNPLNSNIITGDIIKSLNSSDYFDGLINTLETFSYEEDRDTFTVPYDWRIDISSSVLDLKNRIEEIKTERGVNKVDLLAHSMGGLVVKEYLKEYGGDSIEKFIDIATPHTGSPSAYKILMYGDNLGVSKFLGLIGINSARIKEISQNMPSVYELLPSASYFDSNDSNYSYYVFNAVNGTDRLDFADTSAYLALSGRNAALVDRAAQFHQDIDGLNPGDYGVQTYNIVGCGTPTIGQFYVLDDAAGHPIYNIKMIDGDGTVPLKSAEAMNASGTYYLKSATHALMSSTSGVKELVADILTATSTDNLNIQTYLNISTDADVCGMPDGKIVSFHSPITLDVYDSSNNHAGPDANGDIENNIPGVQYETIGDNKFAFLPEGTDYTIQGSATDSGMFDVRIQELLNGEVAHTTLWTDVPLISSTQVEFTVGADAPTQINVDTDNDGTYESVIDSSTSVEGIIESTGKAAAPPRLVNEPIVSRVSSQPQQLGEVLGVTTSLEREMAISQAESDLINIMQNFIILLQSEIGLYSN